MGTFRVSILAVCAASLIVIAGALGRMVEDPLDAAAKNAAPAAAPAPAPAPAAATPAAPATPAAMKIAVCDVYKVADRLTKTERFQKEVADKRKDLENRIAPVASAMEELTKRLQETPKDKQSGPEWEAAVGEYQRKNMEARQLDETLKAEFSEFLTLKNFDAYKEVLASVDAVAAKKGYTHVFSSRSIADMEKPSSPLAFTQGLLARPVLVSPAGDDITLDVLRDLKLE
ncbi:MAG: OmpH family outer membrane protein [Phycisphaerales bacterium]|nr:OmpH family outer membrane protein [Phycisphaerales bacterium]